MEEAQINVEQNFLISMEQSKEIVDRANNEMKSIYDQKLAEIKTQLSTQLSQTVTSLTNLTNTKLEQTK